MKKMYLLLPLVAALTGPGLSGCIAASVVGNIAAAKLISKAQQNRFEQQFEARSTDVTFAGAVQALPQGRVAVWPGDQAEVALASRLEGSLPPSEVSALLKQRNISEGLEGVADATLVANFRIICGAHNDVTLVTAARRTGLRDAEVLGHSCSEDKIVWRDTLRVAGTPSVGTNTAAAQVWAERIKEAQSLSASGVASQASAQ